MRRRLAWCLALRLLAGACGGGDSKPVETGASTTTTGTASTVPITPDGSGATTAVSAAPGTGAPGGATTAPAAPGSTAAPTTKPGPCDVGPQPAPPASLSTDDA